MNDYSAFFSSQSNNIPVLVIHDNNDVEVPVKAGIHIHNYLKTEHYF
jgi:predicted esterase